MKRSALALIFFFATALAFAADQVALDRNGVFWRLEATPSGTLLVGTKDGQEVARSLVPFPLGVAGQTDRNLQMVADDLSGKVVLAWQRQWGPLYSDIVLAVWNQGTWERVSYLTGDSTLQPRNPSLKLSSATSSYPDPEDPEKTITVTDSFALVLWWQGTEDQQRAKLAVLHLQASPEEENSLRVYELATSPGFGINCAQPLPAEALEHPTFANEPPGPVSHLLVASPTTCLLFVHEIQLQLEPPTSNSQEGGMGAVALRRRHTPIFGVRKVLPVTGQLAAAGTQAVIGADLKPVLYRVVPEGVEYTVADEQGWSPKRLLRLEGGLTLDRALALVAGLAR